MQITERLIPGNFSRGRTRKIDLIVVHVMEGTMGGTLSHFSRKDPPDPVSAHYGISRSGEVVRYVRDEDTAWHAGRVLRPTAELVIQREGWNPNTYSLGIENEGTGKEPPTEAQVRANVELIRDRCARYGIPMTRRHIVGHREIFAGKSCPGLIDVDEIVARARWIPKPDPTPPRRPLRAIDVPPNLEKIILPNLATFEEAARHQGKDPERMTLRDWLEVAEFVFRVMTLSGVRGVEPAANVLDLVLREGT